MVKQGRSFHSSPIAAAMATQNWNIPTNPDLKLYTGILAVIDQQIGPALKGLHDQILFPGYFLPINSHAMTIMNCI